MELEGEPTKARGQTLQLEKLHMTLLEADYSHQWLSMALKVDVLVFWPKIES